MATAAAAAIRPKTAYKQARDVELKAFSRKLWRLMVSKGWNQAELARQAGIGRDVIGGYVRGLHLPEPPHAKKLADALSVNVDAFFNLGGPDLARSDAPPIELRATTDGKAMLHVNLEVPMEVAVRVLSLIQERVAVQALPAPAE